MHPKVMLVVSRSHWWCVACKVHNKRTVSIDQHLQSAHPHFAVIPPAETCTTSVENTCCHSDGELDTAFPTKDILPLKTVSSSETKKNPLLEKECEVQKLVGRDTLRQFCGRQKRNSRRKSGAKNERQGDIVADTYTSRLTSRDVDEDCQSLDEDAEYLEHVSTTEEKADEKRTQRKSQAVPKIAHLQTQHSINNGRRKGGRKPAAVKTLKDQNNVTVSSKAKGTVKRRAKAVDQLCSEAEEGCEDSELVNVKQEETAPDYSETETAHAFGEVNTVKLGKHSRKKLRQVDKSKIATSCVPWLLDSGRKAGEKVTKKNRRPLTPEEKQAVRKLYGVCLPHDQPAHSHMQSLNMPGGTRRQYGTEAPSMSTEENPTSLHKMNPEEDSVALHRSFLVNMFSQGTRDYFMDSSRAHENLYPGYGGGAYNQQHHQHSLYTSQASDFYSPLQNIPSQRSNLMNFQAYAQPAPPLLTAPSGGDSLRQQQGEVSGYCGQDMTGLSHLHPAVPPAVCPPPPLTATAPSVPTTNYSITTGPLSAVPHSVPPSVDCDVKSDPASLHQTHTVPQNVPKLTVSVSSNSQNHCSVCKQTFESASAFAKHQSEVAGFDSVDCKRCNFVFHGMHELNLHVFTVHEVEKQAFCFTCDEDATGIENLERHVHKHAHSCERQLNKMRFHDCRLCGEELPSSYASLRTHYYQHHVAHVCSECFQHFMDLQAYKVHCRTHGGKLFLCSICGTKFESVEDFEGHAPCPEDIWAEDGKGDQCGKCGLWCPNRAVVEAHRRQHRSQDDVQAYRQGAKVGFPCMSCEKVFKNKHACRRHVKMVHQGVSCYKHYCEYCGKGFLTKGHMRDHIALHHLNIKRYSCDYCSQQFVCAPTLRRHVRKEHTKHKPYECQHCGERFFEKTPLQRHLTQHTGLAPFMCEHCGKGFYTKHSFTNHASTHSSVKDFVCSGCQKGFTRKYNLQAHVKICKML